MSEYEYPGTCLECKYSDLGEHEFPCAKCRHAIPINEPEYRTAPEHYVPKHLSNPVSHPSHYTQGNIECIDAMVAAFGKEVVEHFCICNAFKYIWRSEHKNGMEDIDKSLWYLTKYKELKSS